MEAIVIMHRHQDQVWFRLTVCLLGGGGVGGRSMQEEGKTFMQRSSYIHAFSLLGHGTTSNCRCHPQPHGMCTLGHLNDV